MNKTFDDIINKFPSDLKNRILNLKNVDQRRDFHPEGDVLTHTKLVFNRLADVTDDIDILLAAVFHDIGKDSTTAINPKTGKLSAMGHEKVSASLVNFHQDVIKDFGGDPQIVHDIVLNHMRIHQINDMRPFKQDKFRSIACFSKLDKFSQADFGGFKKNKND